ncbi:MAG: hypothetical protein NT169_14585 [Chloroflexi bacterium]|nr:hypothetical protein [Chloroflexota bacterium]
MKPNLTQTLSGIWKLAVDPENRGRDDRWFDAVRPDAQEAPVPGIIQQVFPAYHGVAWYWHSFRFACGHTPGDRTLIRFGAVDYLADVWLNGKHAGTFEGGETPFELDVSDLIQAEGDNLLAVRVLNPTNEPIDGYLLNETPHRNKVIPPRPGSGFDSGGIMYPVVLRCVPPAYITDLFVRPNASTGEIAVTVSVRNTRAATVTGSIALSVSPATGGDVLEIVQGQGQFPPGYSEHECAITVTQPHLWNLDDPFLYRVTAVVTTEAGDSHAQGVRCGFRDLRICDGYFYLNGKRIFLKSTHTGNAMPIGIQAPVLPDLIRRDLIYAKASGFNTIRFIAGVSYPEQLDFCDEIGLMVWQGCFAGWCLADSPKMAERYDHSTSEMIRRDRNHPSVTLWELLNETRDGAVFRQAVAFLPKLRDLDPTRLVLLSSGRWDGRWTIGSASNPDSTEWEPVWGVEGPEAPTPATVDPLHNRGYVENAGDAHFYPKVPQSAAANDLIRNLGRESKPVLLSEYGIGSLFDVIREWRHFEQVGARPDLEDASWLREQSEGLYADWGRLGFDDVYPFPEDLLRESQRLHARQRTLGFDLIRANPKLCGYNLTGILDHGMTGEGLWSYWREWKPATFDAVADGWSPLRWCLFADPLHGYSGREVTIEAVLATEDVLQPGEYPARFRVFGPAGIVWERVATVTIPDPPPLAVPVIRETFRLAGPPGRYTFAANLERGGAATGGSLAFHVSDPATWPRLPVGSGVTLWGIEPRAERWLTAQGLECRPLEAGPAPTQELILIGKPEDAGDAEHWTLLKQRMTAGATLLFLSAQLFKDNQVAMDWLPLKSRGRCYTFNDWLYHKECVAKRHPVFAGLQGPGILDMDYYGQVIPHEVFEGIDTPDETIVAAFATGHHSYPRGYGSSIVIGAWRSGGGRFILSTPYVLENLDLHPAADRLLVNLIRYGQHGAKAT